MLAFDYDKIVSIIGDDERYTKLYLIKIETTNRTYVKIGISKDYYSRFSKILETYTPMGRITPLLIAKMKNNDPHYFEKIFKSNNNDYVCRDVFVNSNSRSTESYPYDNNFKYRFFVFYNNIKDEIDKCYYNNDDPIIKYIREHSISKITNTTKPTYFFNKIYINDVLNCPTKLLVKELEGKSCAVFFDDEDEKMYGWYEGTIKLFNQRKKRENNCTFEYLYDNKKYTTDLLIKHINYGTCWVLIDETPFYIKIFKKNTFFYLFIKVIIMILIYNIIIFLKDGMK